MGKLFDPIIGNQLSSVIFVQDYLQLDFDGNRLTYYCWPVLYVNTKTYTIVDQEYRNVLCGFIAKIVMVVSIVDEDSLTISFQHGESIKLNLKDAIKECFYFVSELDEWGAL